MTSFQSFEDMEVWKASRILVRTIREICKRQNVRTDFSFVDQISKAARSISANIAEGNDAQTNPEFITFLGYAKRSAAEVRSHLHDALDDEYISRREFDELNEQTKIIGRMLSKLISYLRSIENNAVSAS